ncbi:helical backbone metal receptor [Psychroflexus sp. MES1-P1E]|uniref:helical backbone metal receptor n=1 Tax=Psychroflexus sp. MES1-P1E TaxID=2058320 RepID=UPI000C7D7F54|nr:helical backbone metal receptor [Psychroflexus sp. MES1-P1E]PKG43664.1 cobalamin-binding protein [Psychroflexus sp. MES1-P1E]
MKDQLGRGLYFETIPQRLVCLVPSLTELLVDLGLRSKLVGVTKFCVHPKDIKENAEIIGGTKNVKFDKIKALQPDFILANKEENTFEDIDLLSNDLKVYVSDINNLKDLKGLITDISFLFGVAEKGLQLIEDIESQFLDFQNFIKNKPKLKVAYFIWRNPWMVVGSSTFINYMLELNNFENVYAHLQRYPEVDIKALKRVDYVLLSSEPFLFKEAHKAELSVKDYKIEIVDGEYFSWYGSRLVKAFSYFKLLRDKL